MANSMYNNANSFNATDFSAAASSCATNSIIIIDAAIYAASFSIINLLNRLIIIC